MPWEPPLDLRELESHSGVLTWSTAPLEQGVTMHGWGELELFAATDCEDTDWHVKLADVDPDGRSLCVGWGCLRALHAEGLETQKPVTPGEVVTYKIELSPAFHTFKPGHRIRVVLASSDYPWFARNLNQLGPIAHQSEPRTATNTVHHGVARPSCLRLSVEG
jgi:putative CocE/NonD family hydrolase